MQVINFFIKGLVNADISANADGSGSTQVKSVRWFAARYEVKSKKAYFLRNGGTEVGKAITLSESMTEGILAMDKTKV
tara:strand:- start:451 stop:684 length:234 start_codon:yes stop_codon:yes gene_type:complete